ncbi:MAG: DUF2520 domain-containing protein [Phycisphaerae bacterium]|nr:DUF2520 domain-containing protein [Phycisphaerae bacterium]
MAARPDISIIGPGKVGSAMARVAFRVGYRIAAIAGGSDGNRTARLAESLDAKAMHSAEAAAAGQLVLLTVRDGVIESVCRQLAAAGGLAKKPMVVHCSGALDCEVLASAKKCGCGVASMHPLQTFPSVEAAIERLPGTYWFLEGDAAVTEILGELAHAMGGHSVNISPQAKPLYHAAAVMSSNYITTLLDTAGRLLQKIGLSDQQARQAIGPLVHAAVKNALTQGTPEALTGPIARGDVGTVAKHIEAMGKLDEDDILRLYRAVGTQTTGIARAADYIDEQTASELLQRFEENS